MKKVLIITVILTGAFVFACDSQTAQQAMNRGSAAFSAGNYDQAVAEYTKAIRLNPYDANPYIFRGNSYNMKGYHMLAISDFEAALRLDPK